MKTLKLKIVLSVFLLLLAFTFCTESNSLIPSVLDSGVTIAQSSNKVSVAMATFGANSYDETTNILFTKDSVFVTVVVTLYNNGEASVTLSNSTDAKVYTLNSNRTIAKEFLNFKPTEISVKVSDGYSATVALVAECK